MNNYQPRELTGSEFSVVEVFGERLSSALMEASLVIARQESLNSKGQTVNDRGAVRIYHAEHDDGHQVLVIFEDSKYA